MKKPGRKMMNVKRCLFTLTPETELKLIILSQDKKLKKSELLRDLIECEYSKR